LPQPDKEETRGGDTPESERVPRERERARARRHEEETRQKAREWQERQARGNIAKTDESTTACVEINAGSAADERQRMWRMCMDAERQVVTRERQRQADSHEYTLI
jgi:hypothetical protein